MLPKEGGSNPYEEFNYYLNPATAKFAEYATQKGRRPITFNFK